eukprot:TRINITY_DN22047_c0_g1_i1.p2 TRINITY_DN22047_c0_g1~~TRINITY_DN22047_c0_g1_i1.p2  ORF type:complete len:439 (+),score=230.31 TRINITY_DN22047_c0_g1_i1:48-1319(+)
MAAKAEMSEAGITRMAGDSMASNMPGSGGDTAPVDDGTMEDILEKLKLLNYHVNFIQSWPSSKGHNFRPLTRTYFCVPAANSNEQYFYFASLTAWLVSVCGGKIDAPDQFGDPNVMSTNIIQALKELDLPVRDIMPSKIQQRGYGDSVLQTISMLCDQALKEKGFNFLPPVYPADKYDDDQQIEDPGMGDDGEIADDVAVREDSDDDDWYEGLPGYNKPNKEEAGMIESQVNPEAWRLELETVAPQLKLSQDDHLKDWRAHVEWIGNLLKKLNGVLPDVKQALKNVCEDIQKAIEKLQKRESTLSYQFQEQIEKYKSVHQELKHYQENYNTCNQSVNNLSAKLNQITEDLERVKIDIQDRESAMSDSKPLVNIKKALSDLKAETKNMELRIGVLQYTVLHQAIRQAHNSEMKEVIADDDTNLL